MTKSKFVKRITHEIITYVKQYDKDLRDVWDDIYSEIEKEMGL